MTSAALNSGVYGWNTELGTSNTAVLITNPRTEAVIATLPLDKVTFHGEIGVFSGTPTGAAPEDGAIVRVEIADIAGTLRADLGLVVVETTP